MRLNPSLSFRSAGSLPKAPDSDRYVFDVIADFGLSDHELSADKRIGDWLVFSEAEPGLDSSGCLLTLDWSWRPVRGMAPEISFVVRTLINQDGTVANATIAHSSGIKVKKTYEPTRQTHEDQWSEFFRNFVFSGVFFGNQPKLIDFFEYQLKLINNSI